MAECARCGKMFPYDLMRRNLRGPQLQRFQAILYEPNGERHDCYSTHSEDCTCETCWKTKVQPNMRLLAVGAPPISPPKPAPPKPEPGIGEFPKTERRRISSKHQEVLEQATVGLDGLLS